MMEQLKIQMSEQRVHDKDQHVEVVQLLEKQIREGETQLEKQRRETEATRNELEKQRREAEAERKALEAKFEAELDKQRREAEAERKALGAKLEAQRKELVVLSDARLDDRRRETEAQARMSKVAVLQQRLEVMHGAKLLEDGELSTIEDKVADAIGAARADDDSSAWECVMQMIKLSEGITSEKVFARQLRRKFM